MIDYLKKVKHTCVRFAYLYLPFIFNNTKKTSYYKFVDDGYNELLYNGLELNEDSVVFDVGGYMGEFTKEIQRIANCIIYIFEPVKKYYQIIIEDQNQNQKAHCFNFGLSSYSETTTINVQGESSSIFVRKNNHSEDGREEIKIEAINKFITDNNLTKIDLLKLNIEGAEYELLDSMCDKSEIIHRVKTLLIQFHDFVPDAKKKREKIQKKLSLTHIKDWDYPFIWEKWTIK